MSTFDDILSNFSAEIKTAGIIEIEDVPNIDLYMDQVTTFMDRALGKYKRYDEDKILTKTMINNYTKAKIFPPPIKKKYSRAHLLLLIMIYHLKSVLSIGDIGILFQPILASKSYEDQEAMVLKIYGGFIHLQRATISYMKDSMEGRPNNALLEGSIVAEYGDELSKKILLVLLLATRANAEKQMAERVLDFYF